MKRKNYYEILEVLPTASQNEVKRSFYNLAKKFHPDINPKYGNIFKQINEAYAVLNHPIKRKEYDNKLSEAEIEEAFNYVPEPEEKVSTTFDYYDNAEYYQDPNKEPILNILHDFKKYRFEKAIAGIWNRNIFIIFGNAIMCTIATLCIGSSKLFKKLKPKNEKIFKSPWQTWIHKEMIYGRLFKISLWMLTLYSISSIKLIYHIFNIVYWTFKNVIKYFLIPAAIIIGSLIRVGSIQTKRTIRI